MNLGHRLALAERDAARTEAAALKDERKRLLTIVLTDLLCQASELLDDGVGSGLVVHSETSPQWTADRFTWLARFARFAEDAKRVLEAEPTSEPGDRRPGGGTSTSSPPADIPIDLTDPKVADTEER